MHEPTDTTERIAAVLAAYHAAGQFTGAALVSKEGRVVYEGGFGWASLEWRQSNGPTTRFHLGSMTKQFTALLVLQAASAGYLRLDDPVDRWLSPRLPPHLCARLAGITVEHLLEHRSGLVDYPQVPGYTPDWLRLPYTPAAYLTRFLATAFPPGQGVLYSTPGYHVLGLVLEAATGRPFAQLLPEWILRPAGMADSGLYTGEQVVPGLAQGYDEGPDGLRPAPYRDPSTTFSASGMYATVQDLHRWDQALASDRLAGGTRLHRIFAADTNVDALGWEVRHARLGAQQHPVLLAKHFGICAGINSVIVRMPRERHLVALCNNTGVTDLKSICIALEQILYDLPVESTAR